MQTIKTAAIVVLMLTVLYGGYVSLTTPPDPLPEEIQELVIDESNIGDFSGDAFASDLQLTEPPAGILSDAPQMNSSESFAAPASPDAYSVTETPSATGDQPTFGSSFADSPSMPSSEPAPPSKLPAVPTNTQSITPGPIDAYASTDQKFDLPDPGKVAVSVDSSARGAFPRSRAVSQPESTYQMSDQGTPSADLTPSTASGNLGAAAPIRTNPAFENRTQHADLASSGTAIPENRGLTNAIATADKLYQKGQLKEALATLSVFYGLPNVNDEQQKQLLSRLDPLAREVVYSKRHLLEQPYRINASETLAQVANRYEVPWQLLANINQVKDPVTILPGTELKVVRGPFRAEVDITGKELTLFLGDLYAGRFAIEVGNDPAPAPGTFTVQEKKASHVFYDRSGNPIPAGSPENPYGNMWLDLGGQLCIHGSPNTVKPTDQGCISVAADYADDLYGILSQGSSVTIRR